MYTQEDVVQFSTFYLNLISYRVSEEYDIVLLFKLQQNLLQSIKSIETEDSEMIFNTCLTLQKCVGHWSY